MIKYEFHVRRQARDKYDFDKSLFTITGDLIIVNAYQARVLSNKINSLRKIEGKTDLLVTAGQINAFGLIHEIFHYLIRFYEERENPGVLSRAVNYLKTNLGEEELDKIFVEFINEFPPLNVYNGTIKPEDYLSGNTDSKPNKEIILEEILLLYLENINRAAQQLSELFTDKALSQKSKYLSLLANTADFFTNEKPFGPENLPLIDFLKKPIVNSPDNIEGQLDYIRQKWGIYVNEKFLSRLLSGKDLLGEEFRFFLQFGGGKPTPPVPAYKADEEYLRLLRERLAKGERLTDEESQFLYYESERFTQDVDWMPKVVMIAKNVFVWLDQLSRKYSRAITRLNEIPDEELDRLARWNFTALWLIGIWERSSASKKIKQYTGNPEAASSAYSLYDYIIAHELGGDDAFQNLKARAWQRGIRLASDMVPNHTGIFSKWIIEKPDYFIQSDYPPFPGYTFNSGNLSDDDRVEVRIEDKYYSREDAAVVFQRRDSYTGDVKYIYHGNDGTHMPWNDTAQLNLLKAEVRESLIQTIKHVAGKFPIIRFDAAMTLTKKHFQRLWFPQPGTGGDIPSRSDFAMTRAQFDQAMPEEFWREVVDRINFEMPETLLLAEAFWLMEGYFVRTLGMHRVYNSAFMHMMMKEENSKYRDLIKNTLEFNPEILKRYVNFMSNPDEETAINQFGKGDKYFGVSVMMVTLPGLPMFGHGQVEGLSEKYGMEYKRAYYNEVPDEYLIQRHEAEIFPLMRKRHLFSQVTYFEFYNFYDEFGNINENVFAFTNKSGSDKTLVVYNNKFERCSGVINYSVSKAYGDQQRLITKKLAEELDFNYQYNHYYVFTDHRTKLEYLVSGRKIHDRGLKLNLEGFEYRVYLNFKEIYDDKGECEKLSNSLNGAGVPSIEYALKELKLTPVYERLYDLFKYGLVDELKAYCFGASSEGAHSMPSGDAKTHSVNLEKSAGKPAKRKTTEAPLNRAILDRLENFINEIKSVSFHDMDNDRIINSFSENLTDIKYFCREFSKWKIKKSNLKTFANNNSALVFTNSIDTNGFAHILFIYTLLKNIFSKGNDNLVHFELLENLLLEKALFEIIKPHDKKLDDIYQNISLIKALLAKDYLLSKRLAGEDYSERAFISELIGGKEACEYVLLNEFGGIIYYNKERFDHLLNWTFLLSCISEFDRLRKSKITGIKMAQKISAYIKDSNTFINKIKAASENSGYKIAELINLLSAPAQTVKEYSSFPEKTKEIKVKSIKPKKAAKKKIVEKQSKKRK